MPRTCIVCSKTMIKGIKYCSSICSKIANKNKKRPQTNIRSVTDTLKRVKQSTDENRNIIIHRKIMRDINGVEHVTETETSNTITNTSIVSIIQRIQMNEELIQIVDNVDKKAKLMKSRLSQETIMNDNLFLSLFDVCYPNCRKWEPCQIVNMFYKELWFPMNHVSWRSLSKIQIDDESTIIWERIILRKIIAMGMYENATGDELLDNIMQDDIDHSKMHISHIVTHVDKCGNHSIDAKIHVNVDGQWSIAITLYQIDAMLISIVPNNSHIKNIMDIEMKRLHSHDICV